MPTYKRLPVAFRRGEGAWLEDERGERYLDALAGIAVCGLGHAHPAVAAALTDQAQTLVHTSNLYRIPLQERLGARLTRLAGLDRVFFANSGAEANEAAIKLARRYGHRRGVGAPEILVAGNAFHGRTLAALAATGNAGAQEGFAPLPAGFRRIPYDDARAAEAAADDAVVAVLVEPIQGEGGVVVPSPGYLRDLRALCDRRGWLLMLDEVQSGVGRTGRWFAFEHEGVRPDVATLAKALGNGVPIGACLAGGAAADVLGPGSHGSTFGGNPLACRAALAVLDTIEQEDLLARAAALGERLLTRFRRALGGLPGVRAVRGRGLMLGIELESPCTGLVAAALEQRLLLNVTADRVIRLLPPLILSDAEAERIAETVIALVRTHLEQTHDASAARA